MQKNHNNIAVIYPSRISECVLVISPEFVEISLRPIPRIYVFLSVFDMDISHATPRIHIRGVVLQNNIRNVINAQE